MKPTSPIRAAETPIRCGCCGQVRSHVTELGATPGVFVCRRCALWAAGRARRPAAGVPARASSTAPARASTDRLALHEEMNRAASTFSQLVRDASPAELHRRSAGTRWNNQQLLFHMVFGYLLVLRLLPLVRLFARLPEPVSRAFAATLQATTRPFHVINYLGSWGGGTALTPALIDAWMYRTIWRLHRRLDAESDAELKLRMHFPVGWDPYFTDTMTLAELYRYATKHFEHHRAQLTLDVDET